MSFIMNPSRFTVASGVLAYVEDLIEDIEPAIGAYSLTKLEDNKLIFCYKDNTDSNHGKAVIITISGTSITLGTIFKFHSAYTIHLHSAAVSSTKLIITFKDYDGSSVFKIKAVCLSIDGTSITAGTVIDVVTGNFNVYANCPLDATHSMISFNDTSVTDNNAIAALTLSGTSLTLGNKLGSIAYVATSLLLRLSSTTALFLDSSASGNYEAAIVTMSGTGASASLSKGSSTEVVGAAISVPLGVELGDNKVLIGYRLSAAGGYATAITVSGSTISAGSQVSIATTAQSAKLGIGAFNNDRVFASWDGTTGGEDLLTARDLIIDGNGITMTDPIVLNTVRPSNASKIAGITEAQVLEVRVGNASAYGIDARIYAA